MMRLIIFVLINTEITTRVIIDHSGWAARPLLEGRGGEEETGQVLEEEEMEGGEEEDIMLVSTEVGEVGRGTEEETITTNNPVSSVRCTVWADVVVVVIVDWLLCVCVGSGITPAVGQARIIQSTLDIMCPYKGWRLYFSGGLCVLVSLVDIPSTLTVLKRYMILILFLTQVLLRVHRMSRRSRHLSSTSHHKLIFMIRWRKWWWITIFPWF